jgi:hypothetical protein
MSLVKREENEHRKKTKNLPVAQETSLMSPGPLFGVVIILNQETQTKHYKRVHMV